MFTRPKQVTLKYQHYKELIPLKNGSKWYYKRNEFGDLEYYVNGVLCVLSTHKLELMVDDNGTAGLYKCIKTENKNIFSKEIIDR